MELRHDKCGFKEEVEELIKAKYGIDEIRNGSIIDQSGNQIFFKNDITPSLSYLTRLNDQSMYKKELNEIKLISDRKSSVQVSHIIDLI